MDAQVAVIIVAIIASIVLGAISNWIYDLLRTRGFFPDKPTLRALVIIILASIPLILLVALPEIYDKDFVYLRRLLQIIIPMWLAVLIGVLTFALGYISGHRIRLHHSGSFLNLSLDQVANADILEKYSNPPLGENRLLIDVPFTVNSGRSIFDSANLLREGKRFTTIELKSSTNDVRSVYVLINSGGSHTEYNSEKIGRIQLVFENGTLQDTELILGKNIREWAPGNSPGKLVDRVESSSSQLAWQGSNVSGNRAVIDRLEIPILRQNRLKKLEQILVFHDRDTEIPAFLIFAMTIECTDSTA